jgi:hypothetical protein
VAPGIYIEGTGFEDEKRRDPEAFQHDRPEYCWAGWHPGEVAAVVFLCSARARNGQYHRDTLPGLRAAMMGDC